MQVEKVSSFSTLSVQKKQSLCSIYTGKVSATNNDSISFGHNIMFPDTQTVIRNLINRLSRFNRSLEVNDIMLGKINASTNTKKGAKIWNLVISSSRGKGVNKEINTYYYNVDGEIAKEVRLGSSNRFIEEEKIDETGKLEWNNAVQAIATVLFRHLPR
jgi:hypothetical protein